MSVLAAFFCGRVSVASAAYYDSGRSGDSWEDAYVISSASDLIALRDRVNNNTEASGKYYVLASDIDLTSRSTTWEGIGQDPYNNGTNFRVFSGHFDGQNHTISLNTTMRNVFGGLFLTVRSDNDSIAIRNLNVTGTVAADCASSIVHYLYSGIVENCSFTGTIAMNGMTSQYGAGGIVGHLEGGTVRSCRVDSTITGGSYAGGIAGEVEAGNIENCTVSENTTLTAQQVGGIAGEIASGFSGRISGNTWPSRYPESGNDYTPSDTPPATDNTPTSGATTSWNGHRYQLYTGSISWEQAKSQCESLGGHLATITSQQEQRIVAGLLSGSNLYWLGASANSSGLWHWLTDEVFEQQYANFAVNQPDGSGNRLAISSSGWDDLHDSTSASGFICEWDDEPETVTSAPYSSLFQDWLDNPQAWADSEVIPSPIDYSHLAANPPRVSASGLHASALEARYDGSAKLPAVRDQGDGTNTCWAFAAIGAMEANYIAKSLQALGNDVDLSELQVSWEAKSADQGPVADERGSVNDAINVLLNSTSAPVNESEFPYSWGYSDGNPLPNSNIAAQLNGHSPQKAPITLTDTVTIAEYINAATSDQVKQHIKDNGAVWFSYASNSQGYSKGRETYYFSGAGSNHAALIVGWDDNYPASSFNENPGSNGAWLIRNSYGTRRHGDGYFWMSYSQGNNADSSGLNRPTVFIVSEDRLADKLTNEHNTNPPTEVITPQWSANVFHSGRDEDLIRVAFYVPDNNVKYEVYVNTFGKERPTDPGKTETPVLSGEISYAGSHTLTLPQAVALYKGDYYAIIVKLTPTSDYEFASEVEAAIAGYVSVQVNEGESFFATGEPVPSVWQDGKYIQGGPFNACIQGITVPRVSLETGPKITTSSLPDGNVGENYAQVHLAASGIGTLEWRCGNIPEGMALSKSGILSGTPVHGGEYDLKIMVFNNTGSDEVTLRLSVKGDSSSGVRSSKDKDDWPCNSGFGIVSLLAAMKLFWRKSWR